MPMQNCKTQPTAKLRLVKARKSTIGSPAVSTRQKKAIAETKLIAAQTATEVSCSHSYCGPSSSTYSSAPRKPAMKIKPHQSKRSSSAKWGSSKSTSASTPMVMTMPAGTLMKNSQCHDIQSVMTPPTVGPTVGASVATSPMIGAMIYCLERGNTV